MVKLRRILLILPAAGILLCDEAPRSKPADYPVHAVVAGIEVGADYLVRSIPTEKGVFVSKDYLVIELAVFATRASQVTVSSDRFLLRVNGKLLLHSQSPGFVAASLQYPDWQQRPGATASAGAGNATINIGGPAPASRFPGDNRGTKPWPNPVPVDASGGAVEQEPPPSIESLIAKAALPEGPAAMLVKGCLFFPYDKKTKSIKSLELIHGDVVIKLL